MKNFVSLVCFALFLNSGCAFLHSTQIGEIDSRIVQKGKRFEVLLSETGVNFEEGAAVLKALTNDTKRREQIGKVQQILGLFQMGPRTGNPVFNPAYADAIFDLIKEKCPSENFSGLMSIRETAKYPAVSGEIIKIVGFCNEV
jgi:hypothetical protein